MSLRFLRIALASLLVVVAHQSASAQQFTLFSQNTLHLGWGKVPYQTTKNAYLVNYVVKTPGNAYYDVVLLQEVMQQMDLTTLTFPPGTYTVVQTAPLGPGNYKERYGFLVRTASAGVGFNIVPTPTAQNFHTYTDPGNSFSRPPTGVLIQSGTRPTWVINYHARFGQVRARRGEVSAMSSAITQMQAKQMGNPQAAYARFVVGGDWNFPATDQAFTNIANSLGVPISINPTANTSLKRNGGLSQPYDHFVWRAVAGTCDNGTCVACNTPTVVAPPNGQTNAWFRTNFSDHLGVSINVQY